MKWVNRAIMLVVGLVILGAIIYGFMPKPIEVEFAKAARGDIYVTIDEEGHTRVKDRFTITAPLPGTITRVSLKAGDTVAAGDVITVLAPSRPPLLDVRARAQAEANVKAAEAAVQQAGANVTAAVADHELAKKEHTRLSGLLKSRSVSQEQVDVAASREVAAQASLESARFGEQAAKYQLEAARALLLEEGAAPVTLEIKSPVAGKVLRVMRESEGPVMAGEMLVEIGDPARIEIVSDVLSTEAVRVEKDQRVIIERWGGAKDLEGKVRMVEPGGITKVSSLGVEEQRVNVIIDLVSAPEAFARLGDGFRVEVRVVTGERRDVVKVPTGALFNVTEGRAVYAVVDGKAERRVVVVGAQNGIEAEIVTGVNDGEIVIVHPGDDVTHGAQVKER
jgi:HlyD family secretion protein